MYLPASGGDAAHQRRPVALLAHPDDACTELGRDRWRAVIRPVVCDDHLTRDPVTPQRVHGLAHAGPDRVGLVEARHHDRDLDFTRRDEWFGESKCACHPESLLGWGGITP